MSFGYAIDDTKAAIMRGPMVSGVITSFNEEHNIGDCIASMQWCDEIIVVGYTETAGDVDAGARHVVMEGRLRPLEGGRHTFEVKAEGAFELRVDDETLLRHPGDGSNARLWEMSPILG